MLILRLLNAGPEKRPRLLHALAGVPANGQHMSEAEEWINFIASTKANLANMDYIWYASPNGEALEEYPAYYEEVNEEPLDPEIYEVMAPSEEVLHRCEIYENLPTETLRLYDRLWTRLGV